MSAMNYDDETLMAYADGELDETTRAGISRALEQDPELARRVARHRALRTEVAGAFATVIDQPVPDRLLAASKGESRATDTPRGNVVNIPSLTARAPARPWRLREWTAMAASLVLGIFVAGKLLPGGGEVETRRNALVARGELMTALDSQLASNQGRGAAVHIGLTFRDQQGAYCRTFVSRGMSTAGLACRRGGDWRIEQTNSVELGEGDLRQAAASMPPALLQAVEARISGEPLDADGEAAAVRGQWKPAP